MCCQIGGSESASSQNFLLRHVQSCSGRASLEEQRKSADRSHYGIVVGQRTPSECEAKHRLGKSEILGKDVLVVLSTY